MSTGSIRTVRDLVVLVQFEDDSPDIGELLVVQNQNRSVLLVDHLNDRNIAACLSIFSDRSIQKNMAVARTEKSIEIPVGSQTVGRVFDALGRPLDGLAMPKDLHYKSVLEMPPRTTSFKAARPEILETGI